MTEYTSKEYLEQLKAALSIFIPSTVGETIKPKREAAIKSTYEGIYDIQIAASSIIGDIEISHLLGMNEVVVPHIVEEYAKLLFIAKLLESKLKGMNQYSEVAPALSSLSSALKTKEIGKYLFNDLEKLVSDFSIEIDIKEYVQSIKSYISDDSLKL